LATARELLEQADMLMRRNRLREVAAAAGPASDFPLLTDAVAPEDRDLPAASFPAAQPAAAALAYMPAPAMEVDGQAAAGGDVPILTEIVEDFEPISIIGAPDDPAEAAQWPDFDDGELVPEVLRPVVREAPSAPMVPEAAAMAMPQVVADTLAPPLPRPGDADLDARWDTLAEDVRMQVLQRIDIFTDTGLQKQLTARLQPIVDRASADLVATINQQVGQLLRAYVAEAIEREIEKWRHGDGA
jgi:hypothetical protein